MPLENVIKDVITLRVILNQCGPGMSDVFGPGDLCSQSATPSLKPPRGYTREAAIRLNRIPENAFIASVARLKCLWFSSGVGFGRLSNFPLEGEPAISGRIEPLKPTLGSNFVKELRVQESKTEIQLNAKHLVGSYRSFPCVPLICPARMLLVARRLA